MLITIISADESKEIIDKEYETVYNYYYYLLNLNKLGFLATRDISKEDKEFVDRLYTLLEEFGFDLTVFFRNLSNVSTVTSTIDKFIETAIRYSMPFSVKLDKIKPDMDMAMLKKLDELKNSKWSIFI